MTVGLKEHQHSRDLKSRWSFIKPSMEEVGDVRYSYTIQDVAQRKTKNAAIAKTTLAAFDKPFFATKEAVRVSSFSASPKVIITMQPTTTAITKRKKPFTNSIRAHKFIVSRRCQCFQKLTTLTTVLKSRTESWHIATINYILWVCFAYRRQ
jgi:hypothetical protein